MIRRVYTKGGVEIELVLDGATLVVDRGPDGREQRVFASADEARAAFDAGVHALTPRFAIDTPSRAEPELAWFGPDGLAEELWLRSDACACETPVAPTDDEVVLADWQLEHPDPHVRALGAFSKGMRLGAEAHVDAWLSGQLAHANVGFRGGLVQALEVAMVGSRPDVLRPEALKAFLALPIASRLRRLALQDVGAFVPWYEEHYVDQQPNVVALAESKPSALRELEIVGGRVRDLAPLASLPALERLTLAILEYFQVDTLASPTLRELDLQYTGVHGDMRRWSCPALRSLTIGAVDLEGALASELPFTQLTVTAGGPENDVLEQLRRWPSLARLEELVIHGVAPPAALGRRFAHLKRLEFR